MSDDPFGDLDNAVADDPDDAPDRDVSNSDIPTGDDSESDSESRPTQSDSDPDRKVTASGDTPDEPAFPFDEARQQAMYARPEAWNALEDALDLEVQRALREAGVRDIPKRELHDAALRVAARHPEAIVDALLDAR